MQEAEYARLTSYAVLFHAGRKSETGRFRQASGLMFWFCNGSSVTDRARIARARDISWQLTPSVTSPHHLFTFGESPAILPSNVCCLCITDRPLLLSVVLFSFIGLMKVYLALAVVRDCPASLAL